MLTGEKVVPECRGPERRIAIMLPWLGGGGAERVMLTLATEFSARGIPVDIVLMSRAGALLDQVPPAVRLVDLATSRSRTLPLTFARYLRDAKPDVVLANMWPVTAACIVARVIARSTARIVVCEHETLSGSYRDWGKWHNLLLRRSISMLYPLADVRLAVSSGVADDLAAISGLPRLNFDVVHNPIWLQPPVSGEQGDVDVAWQGWRGPRILSVGNLKRVKNHALLIHAVSRIPDARLMIVGEGDMQGELEALALRLGMSERVIMPGFVINPAPFYRTADLFALSSDSEGFANVIVEALSCGLPVVSTDCRSGPAEILDNGRFGMLVPVGDASALADAMRKMLAAERKPDILRERARHFSPAGMADRYLSHLLQVVVRSGDAPS